MVRALRTKEIGGGSCRFKLFAVFTAATAKCLVKPHDLLEAIIISLHYHNSLNFFRELRIEVDICEKLKRKLLPAREVFLL